MSSATRPTQPALSLDVEILRNPDQDALRALAEEHTPFCLRTAMGSLDKVARNKARMAKYTYVIDRNGQDDAYSHNTIGPTRAQALIDAQAEYIRGAGKLIAIEAYVGVGPYAMPVEWLYTLPGANIAGMQQILGFPRRDVETPEQLARPFEPGFRLIYTPEFHPDMPGGQAIIVDLDHSITYVMGPDYFGESKKGALRMLADHVYGQGGLLMHSGAKELTLSSGERITMGVLGLSGTGKTTTTFSKQGERVRPIQDDMIAIWPGGKISVTENGCFAKTFGLSADSEPVLYKGTMDPSAWLENVYLDAEGHPEFSKGALTPEDAARLRDILVGTGAPAENVDRYIAGEVSAEQAQEGGIPKDGWEFVFWTENGRSIIPMAAIDDAADLHDVPPLRSLGILNRDEGPDAATPGMVRFADPNQAAAYFMLGETSKTSAAGKDRGKTRSPFTQPFFPRNHSLQARRFSELAATFPAGTTMWMMNTGYVGGDAADVAAGKALKVKIRHSSAMLEALLHDAITWVRDPDFGYEVVDVDAPENADLVAAVGAEILQPRRFYERTGRMDTYRDWVARMKQERVAFLRKHDVDPAIVATIGA